MVPTVQPITDDKTKMKKKTNHEFEKKYEVQRSIMIESMQNIC